MQDCDQYQKRPLEENNASSAKSYDDIETKNNNNRQQNSYQTDYDFIQISKRVLCKLLQQQIPIEVEIRDINHIFGNSIKDSLTQGLDTYSMVIFESNLDDDEKMRSTTIARMKVGEQLKQLVQDILDKTNVTNHTEIKDQQILNNLLVLPSKSKDCWSIILLVIEINDQQVVISQIKSFKISRQVSMIYKINSKQCSVILQQSNLQGNWDRMQQLRYHFEFNEIIDLGDSFSENYGHLQLNNDLIDKWQAEINQFIETYNSQDFVSSRNQQQQQSHSSQFNQNQSNQIKVNIIDLFLDRVNKNQQGENIEKIKYRNIKENQTPKISLTEEIIREIGQSNSLGEFIVSLLNIIKAIGTSFGGELLINYIFKLFESTILNYIKDSSSYQEHIGLLSQNLDKLIQQNYACHQNINIISIIAQFICQVEDELYSNQLGDLVKEILKFLPQLAKNYAQKADNVQYTKITGFENDGKPINHKRDQYLELSSNIKFARGIIQHGYNFLEFTFTISIMLQLINKKIVKQLNQQQNKSDKSPSFIGCFQSEQRNHRITFKKQKSLCITLINMRLFENIQKSVINGLIPVLDQLGSYIISPLEEEVRKKYSSNYYEMKENQQLEMGFIYVMENNIEEKGQIHEYTLEYFMKLLKKNKFASPILECNILNLPPGNIEIYFNGQIKIINNQSTQDLQFIQDYIGTEGIRIYKGKNGLMVSRPNYKNYLISFNLNKQINQFDLTMMAYCCNKIIILHTDDYSIQFGQQNNTNPIYIKHKKGEKSHYLPMVMDENGQLQEINLPQQNNNTCGIVSVLYLLLNEDSLKKGKSDLESAQFASKLISNSTSCQAFMELICEKALKNKKLEEIYLNRFHECGVVGGVDSGFITPISSKNFFEANFEDHQKDYEKLAKLALDINKNYDKEKKTNKEQFNYYLNQQYNKLLKNKDDENKQVRRQWQKYYGGYHELLPVNITRDLFKRSCGLDENYESQTEFQGKQYNWLHLQNALRVQTSTIVYKGRKHNELTDGTGHNSSVQTHQDAQNEEHNIQNNTDDKYHDNLRSKFKNSGKFDKVISDLIYYHLANTKNHKDNPSKDIYWGYNNDTMQNKDMKINLRNKANYNLSVACARNDLKRILIQKQLFEKDENGFIEIGKGQKRAISPLHLNTPRTNKLNKKLITDSFTFMNSLTYDPKPDMNPSLNKE